MEPSKLLTGAAYIRVSTEDQIEYSPDSQLKRIQEYACSHCIQIPEKYIYMDEGISGRCADNRPAFLRMIRTARQKPRPFDLILVWKFSRFARNRQDSIFYKSILRKGCGIDVISVTEQLSSDPTSILIEALLEAMDEYYSINLAQEVRRGMNEKFTRGGVVSTPPFGYRMGEQRYEIDPPAAACVQMIFDDFLRGMSFRQIADKLNQMGVSTSRGNPFQPRTIRYILGNPVYLGLQRRHLEEKSSDTSMTTVQGLHDPLLPQKVFLAAQRRLHHMEESYSHKSRSTPAPFMLRGLVRCSCCGATLTRSSRGNSLQCCRYARGQCKESHSISLQKLNRAVLQQISCDFPFDESVVTLLKEPSIEESLKNELLRSFVSEILFDRVEGTIRIRYRL